jgi:hypothetical protein
VIIELLKSFKNGNVGCGWLILYDTLFNVGYLAMFSYSALYYGDKSLGVCPVQFMAYGLLLYIEFIIQSDVSGCQDNGGTKAKPGGVPSKKGLADGSGDYKQLVLVF